MEPILFNKGEPNTEVMTFRSQGKNYTTTKTVTKTVTKPPSKPVTNYNTTRASNNYTQNRTYNNSSYQPKTATGVNNRGVGSTVKTTTTTSNSSRGNIGTGGSGQIVKETTTKVQMGRRSQFQNQVKPITTVSTERKVYDKNNFFKK